MIEPRVYRTAFIPAILAFIVAMFSLESQPPGASPALPADVLFEGEAVVEDAERIARENPDRTVGSAGDARVADLVATELEARGFDVEVDEFEEDGRELRNVVATRVGSERERVVVVAGRDASSVPDVAGSATDTAALLELATALEGRAPEKTIVLASLDGTTLGDAGARRFADTAADREFIGAALVLSDLGAPGAGGPGLVAWSNEAERGSIGLYRTAEDSLRRELEPIAAEPGIPAQVAQLAVPLGIGGQGVLLEGEIEAIRFSGSGLLPPEGEPEPDPEQVGALGRAALQTAFALDVGEGLEHGPASYVVVSRSLLPGWAMSVLSLSLILPILVASVDAFARARRRREPVGRWLSWLVARIVPFAIGLLVALILVIAGLAPNLAGAAPPPSLEPLDERGAAALGIVAAFVVLSLIFLRPLLSRWGGAPPDAASPGAACAVALVLALATLVVWIGSPVAALVLVPAAHLWSVAALAEGPGGVRGRVLLILGGLLAPATVVLVHMVRLSLDPLEALWYSFLLVAGGQVDLAAALVGCVFLGALTAIVEILLARRREAEGAREAREAEPAVRGPGSYAGPGSLGGPSSTAER